MRKTATYGIGRIYLIRNLVNGKGYVGKTVRLIRERFSDHISCSRRGEDTCLYRAIRKYGAQNFSVEEVASCELSLLDDLERHYIKFYGTRSHGGHGYNETAGGEGQLGWVPSLETRAKIGSAHKGKQWRLGATLSDATKAKIALANKGKSGRWTRTQETRRKIAAANKGKQLSQETKKKISEAASKRKLSDSHKAKISASLIGNSHLLGHHHSEETKMKMSKSQQFRQAKEREWREKPQLIQ